MENSIKSEKIAHTHRTHTVADDLSLAQLEKECGNHPTFGLHGVDRCECSGCVAIRAIKAGYTGFVRPKHIVHTPGPWRLNSGNELRISAADGIGVATTSGVTPRRTYEENVANARLIAAGPELLEALEAIIKGVDAAYINLGMDDRWNYAGVRAIDAARAAIAKATVQWYTKEYKSAGNE